MSHEKRGINMEEIRDFFYHLQGQNALNYHKHAHNDCYEVLQICSGDGVMMVGDKLYPMQHGALYFISGMDIHCSAPQNTENYIRNTINISEDYVNQLAKQMECSQLVEELFLRDGGTCIQLGEREVELVDTEFIKIEGNQKKNTVYSKLNISLSLFKILQLAHTSKDRRTSPITSQVSTVMDYINRNIEKKLTLDSISKEVHISKFYLCHIFKETTQMTVQDYILLRRISIAKKSLLHTQLPLSEIALACGFSSFSYFSKVFREYEGVSPSTFRKQYALQHTQI